MAHVFLLETSSKRREIVGERIIRNLKMATLGFERYLCTNKKLRFTLKSKKKSVQEIYVK